jgi:hypothetical protein
VSGLKVEPFTRCKGLIRLPGGGICKGCPDCAGPGAVPVKPPTQHEETP